MNTTTKNILTLLVIMCVIALTAATALADGELAFVDNAITVTAGGNVNNDLSQDINVSPGQSVTVHLEYQNNFNSNLGDTQIAANANGLDADGFNIDLNDQFTNLPVNTNGAWVLTPQQIASKEFTFSLPFAIDPTLTSFSVDVDIRAQDLDGNSYTDTLTINFEVQREPVAIISDASLANSQLSCNPQTQLTVTITNHGSRAVSPELLVYDQAAVVSSFNSATGRFGSFAAAPKINSVTQLPRISPGQTVNVPIAIDATSLSTGNQKLYLYTVSPFFNQDESFIGSSKEVPFTKSSCILTFTNNPISLVTPQGKSIVFTVTLREALPAGSDVHWKVDGAVALPEGPSTSFTFTAQQRGDHTIKAQVINANDGSIIEETATKTITVTKRFQSILQHNIPDDATNEQLRDFSNLRIWNQFGEIAYQDQVIDLRNVVNLDSIITITADSASVDSAIAPLNKPATITLNKAFANPKVLKDGSVCAAPNCIIISANAASSTVFTVTDFSTYRVIDEQASKIEVSDINVDNVDRSTTVSVDVPIRNSGSLQSLDQLRAELVAVNAKYNAKITGVPETLVAGASATAKLELTIPSDEDSGKHKIGDIKFTSSNDTKTVAIYLNPKSLLTIKEVKVNGKLSGELNLQDPNKIEVEVKNDYKEDMTDVTITVKILDVDSENLEEESDSFDIKKSDSEKSTVEFDLSNENADEEKYTLEITVEGTADDDTKHRTTETKVVDVERANHDLVLKRVELSPSLVQCARDATLSVTVQNTGKSDENDVEIKVSNAQLSLELNKPNIQLDKFSDTDNEDSTTFRLGLENAAAGTYTLLVEAYRDGTVEDSKELTLEVKACGTSSTSQTVQLASDQLSQQLQQQLSAQQQQTGTKATISTSFRETDTYLLLLGIMGVLIFISVVLGLAILIIKKKN
ncbi:TPA: hypothetical protein HA242_01300 [Candidatus Woesearchaeota archaeon]|nr:hypothetical protein [Candidatus Woesearchaeota archaeon]HIH12334.1 hypothetical protein [Candidatus Woesearchaeota archaeon]